TATDKPSSHPAQTSEQSGSHRSGYATLLLRARPFTGLPAHAVSLRQSKADHMKPREIAAADIPDPETFLREVAEPCRPVVIRQLTQQWPIVLDTRNSPRAFRDYVSRFANDKLAEMFVGEPRIAGRCYYGDDHDGFNFERE